VSEKLTPENISTRLRAAKRRKAEALASYEAASAEVAWLEEGLRLFSDDADLDSETPKEILTEIFPEGYVFDQNIRPSLRQAVVVVMREQPGRRWTVTELAEALDGRGWLPKSGGAKRVSDMAGDMVRLGQAVRHGRGVYKLSPELAAALETAPGFRK
jgi:hypothetical protein